MLLFGCLEAQISPNNSWLPSHNDVGNEEMLNEWAVPASWVNRAIKILLWKKKKKSMIKNKFWHGIFSKVPQTGRMVCRLPVWRYDFFFFSKKEKEILACVPLPGGNWFHMTTLVPTSVGRGLKWLPHALLKCLKGEEKKTGEEGENKAIPAADSTAQCLLCLLYFIPCFSSQTFSEILQCAGCLDWTQSAIFWPTSPF